MLLEAFAVERAAVNITPDAELKLRDLLRQMSAAADSFDLAAFHDADVEFHRQVWALAGNEYLSASLEGIAFRLFVLGCLNHGRDRLLASVEQHKGILEGLCSREPKKARADFILHTLHFWDEADKVTPSPPAVYRSSGT